MSDNNPNTPDTYCNNIFFWTTKSKTYYFYLALVCNKILNPKIVFMYQ